MTGGRISVAENPPLLEYVSPPSLCIAAASDGISLLVIPSSLKVGVLGRQACSVTLSFVCAEIHFRIWSKVQDWLRISSNLFRSRTSCHVMFRLGRVSCPFLAPEAHFPGCGCAHQKSPPATGHRDFGVLPSLPSFIQNRLRLSHSAFIILRYTLSQTFN
jgi:hypothetical protein